MSRFGSRVSMFLIAAAVLFAAAAQAAPEELWSTPTRGFAGAHAVQGGIYEFTDYVYDDRGANTSGGAGGDQSYPSDEAPYHRNAADLVELRIWPDEPAGSFTVGVRLNTVDDTSIPVMAVGIADGSAPALAAPWPHGSGLLATGTRYVLTLHGSEAVLTDLLTTTSQSFPVTVHNETVEPNRALENTFTTVIPAAALGLASIPSSGTWLLAAAAGLWDGAAWIQPDPLGAAAYDIAYHNEGFTNWQNNNQADLLLLGDLSSAQGVLDFGQFPDFIPPIASGMTARVYPSPFSSVIGEGIGIWVFEDPAGSGQVSLGNQYRGLFLPYSFYVPADYPSYPQPVPLFFFMHGIGGEHLTNLDAWLNGEITIKALTLFPTGAGEYSFYRDEGAADPVLAMEDAKRVYPIDVNRVYLSGRSMGGLGTFNISTLRPDLFAAAIPWIGTTFEPLAIEDQSVPGNRWLSAHGRTTINNLHNVPLRQNNGAQDPLVNPSWSADDAVAYRVAGIDHHVAVFLERGHEVVNEHQNALYHRVLNGCTDGVVPGCDTSDDPGAFVRDPNPARVIYKSKPLHHVPELGLVYDGAYWVDDIVLLDASQSGSSATVDAVSSFHAHKLHTAGPATGPELRNFAPTDDDYTLYKILHEPAPEARERAFSATLTNTAEVSFDMARAGLDAAATDLDSDGDGIDDLDDNCPAMPNPDQLDRGGINSNAADGIGDACQCGDVTGNGNVNGQDANAIRRHALGIQPNPLFVRTELCDVSGNGECNGQDGAAVVREALGYENNPLFRNACPNLSGGWAAEIDTDVPSNLTFTGIAPDSPVFLNGAQAATSSPAGEVTVSVPAGVHAVGLP